MPYIDLPWLVRWRVQFAAGAGSIPVGSGLSRQ